LITQVLRQIEVAVQAGSALPVDGPALKAVLEQLRPQVIRQLKAPDLLSSQQKWFDDSRNVMLAATMLGAIGTCIARLNHQDTVDYDVLSRAFQLVKVECGGRFGPEGCYCGCPHP